MEYANTSLVLDTSKPKKENGTSAILSSRRLQHTLPLHIRIDRRKSADESNEQEPHKKKFMSVNRVKSLEQQDVHDKSDLVDEFDVLPSYINADAQPTCITDKEQDKRQGQIRRKRDLPGHSNVMESIGGVKGLSRLRVRSSFSASDSEESDSDHSPISPAKSPTIMINTRTRTKQATSPIW
ncbi:hypothetical protein AKO1_003424 [Acrasis kona]|uniref:Uncharacterized protein n=1 Tax=Acrasis kona TaxID=1008807 RepID=A0AAW2ZCT3_9EUKA